MNLVKRNFPFIPSFLDQLADNGLNLQNTNHQPSVNIFEEDLQFVLQFAVPGLSKSDFKIEIDDDLLTVGLEKSEDSKVDVKTKTDFYYRKEFDYNSFKRTFALPENVETQKIEAKYNEGILTLTLPKKKESLPQPKKLISVK